jgi:hypothetical protein
LLEVSDVGEVARMLNFVCPMTISGGPKASATCATALDVVGLGDVSGDAERCSSVVRDPLDGLVDIAFVRATIATLQPSVTSICARCDPCRDCRP